MRKHYRHLLCPLMAVAVTTLSCCALANGVLATQKVTPTETDVPIPVDYFKFNESGDTLLGFADGVTMEDIFLQDFNGIDLSKEAMGQREIKKIAPYAFANVFTYGCPIKTLVLPESVEEIGQGAFYFCPGFTNHLYIPSKLKNIGQDAFFYAGFTGDLVIPDSVISIGAQAFWHIDTLSGTLKIPASVQEIGYRAFKGLVNIEGLDLSEYESIPTWLYKIGTIFGDVGTEEYAHKTVKVRVNDKENSISDWKNILQSQGLGDKTSFESTYAKPTDASCFSIDGNKVKGFKEDVDLSKYNILSFPDNITEVEKEAFKGKITNHHLKYSLQNKVKKYGDGAFKDCSGLICDNVTITPDIQFGDNVFENCKRLTGTIQFVDSLPPGEQHNQDQYVISGNEIFKGCTGITGLSIRNNDVFQGYGIFQNCSSIATIDLSDYITEQTDEIIDLWPQAEEDPSDHLSLGGIASSGIVYVNEDNTFLGPDAGDDSQTNVRRVMINMSDIEQTDIKWADTDVASRAKWQIQISAPNTPIPDEKGYILKNNQECCGLTKYAKESLSQYTTVKTPNVTTSIEAEAFKDIFKQTTKFDRWKLELNLGINVIKDSAFEGCDGLIDSLQLPNSLINIGNKAFKDCCNIDGVLNLPLSVESIGTNSFENTRISSIIFGKNIKSIGKEAFVNSKHMRVIDFSSFSDCPSQDELSIGDDAFDFDSEHTGTVYIHDEDDISDWQELLRSKGLPEAWTFKEVA